MLSPHFRSTTNVPIPEYAFRYDFLTYLSIFLIILIIYFCMDFLENYILC